MCFPQSPSFHHLPLPRSTPGSPLGIGSATPETHSQSYGPALPLVISGWILYVVSVPLVIIGWFRERHYRRENTAPAPTRRKWF